MQARYLRQVQGGYLLGPKLIELGAVSLEQMPLSTVARPHLERLADATRDTIHLGVREGGDVLYIDKIPGTRGLEMRSRIGHRMPLAWTGIGKALMLDLAGAGLGSALGCGTPQRRPGRLAAHAVHPRHLPREDDGLRRTRPHLRSRGKRTRHPMRRRTRARMRRD